MNTQAHYSRPVVKQRIMVECAALFLKEKERDWSPIFPSELYLQLPKNFSLGPTPWKFYHFQHLDI